MKKCNLIKRVLSLATVLIVAFTPMSIMAADVTEIEVEKEERLSARYTDWIDQDISVYVPDIDDTVHGHLRLLYSYSEGSWVYIEDEPIPTFSNIYTETGFSENDSVSAYSSYGVVDFDLTLSSNTAVKNVVLRVVIDIYGDVDWFIV